jgi:hypothetical protein
VNHVIYTGEWLEWLEHGAGEDDAEGAAAAAGGAEGGPASRGLVERKGRPGEWLDPRMDHASRSLARWAEALRAALCVALNCLDAEERERVTRGLGFKLVSELTVFPDWDTVTWDQFATAALYDTVGKGFFWLGASVEQRGGPTLVLRLRQVTGFAAKDFQENDATCPVCFESDAAKNVTLMPCEHIVCAACAKKLAMCPCCREPIVSSAPVERALGALKTLQAATGFDAELFLFALFGLEKASLALRGLSRGAAAAPLWRDARAPAGLRGCALVALEFETRRGGADVVSTYTGEVEEMRRINNGRAICDKERGLANWCAFESFSSRGGADGGRADGVASADGGASTDGGGAAAAADGAGAAGGERGDVLYMCSAFGCGKHEARRGEFARCSRCRRAVYCGRECQLKAHKAGHKLLCERLSRDAPLRAPVAPALAFDPARTTARADEFGADTE